MIVDWEKVIKGMKQHRDGRFHSCDDCPYLNDTDCQRKLYSDVLFLLKEQEERIKKIELERSWDEKPDMMGKW